MFKMHKMFKFAFILVKKYDIKHFTFCYYYSRKK